MATSGVFVCNSNKMLVLGKLQIAGKLPSGYFIPKAIGIRNDH